MLMAFPFLMLEDIDEVWEEMIESKPDISATCHFPRDLWNDIYSSYTHQELTISVRLIITL